MVRTGQERQAIPLHYKRMFKWLASEGATAATITGRTTSDQSSTTGLTRANNGRRLLLALDWLSPEIGMCPVLSSSLSSIYHSESDEGTTLGRLVAVLE